PEREYQRPAFPSGNQIGFVIQHSNPPRSRKCPHRRDTAAHQPAHLRIVHAFRAASSLLRWRASTHCASIPAASSATRAAAPGVPSFERTSPSPARARDRSSDDSSSSGCSASATSAGTRASWTNSLATSLPATMFTSPMNGILTTRRAMAYVQPLVRYATTSGQSATAASRVVVPLLHNAAVNARSTWKEALCAIGYGHLTGSS